MRFLKFATVVMGIMIIVLTVIVAVEIYKRATDAEYKAMRTGVVVEVGEDNLVSREDLELPFDVVVNSITPLEHGRIVLHVTFSDGSQKLIYVDSRTGEFYGETVLTRVD